MTPRPNAFLVGQPKSGTTSLHRFLADQPDVFMSVPKEPHFFCTDLHAESDQFHGRELFYPFRKEEEYLRLFREARGAQVVGEASTEYLFSVRAAENIARFAPKARIVVVLREPAEFVASLHSTFCSDMLENEPDLAAAFRRGPHRPPPKARAPSLFHYAARLRYDEQVARYLAVFPRQQVLVLVFEDLRDAARETLPRLLEFLGLPGAGTGTLPMLNTRRRPRWLAAARLAFDPRTLRALRHLLPYHLYGALAGRAKKLLWRPAGAVSISAELRREIWATCEVEIRSLSERLGIDFLARWQPR